MTTVDATASATTNAGANGAALGAGEPTASVRAELDSAVAELQQGERQWASLDLKRRGALLARLQASVARHADEWVRVAGRDVKGLDPHSPFMGEEWMSGPYAVISGIAKVRGSVAAVAAGRSPLAGARLRTAPGGRVAVPVLPTTVQEWVLFHGFDAEVWMPPGRTPDEVRESAGLGAHRPRETGGVGLVLGAGNITSIPPLDVLYELVANNRVTILKLNPTMDALLPVFRAALRPLLDASLLRIVVGGADVGSYLAHHPQVSHVHITGSAVTHDAIVWGTGDDGRARRAAGTPLLEKEITSELGGVAPIIVVPGEWSAADLRYQAEHVVTQRLHNGGYNCIAGQVVVLSRDWPQREAFLDEIRSALERTPWRKAWYPGGDERVARAADAYPGAEGFGVSGCRLLVDVRAGDAAASDSSIASTEYFSPVLGVVDVAGTGQAFLEAAADFANDELLGTLGANVLIDPVTRRAMGERFRESLARLRYGTIAVNAWTAVGFLSAAAPWGAFPGHPLDDVQSGRGIVHNALLIDGPERTVITGPFRPFPRSVLGGEFALFPKPPWFVTSRSATATGRALSRYAARPSWAKVPGIFAAVFRA